MSFAFSFAGDDLEEEEQGDVLSRGAEEGHINTANLKPPEWHSLNELLSSIPSQLSYNAITVPAVDGKGTFDHAAHNTPVPILRRSLFDIRTQLMAESDLDADSEADNLISGLDQGDLTSGIYEGGFKTWECAVDLASLVTDLLPRTQNDSTNLHVIELGAGSAIPSLTILHHYLTRSKPQTMTGSRDSSVTRDTSSQLRLTLCDYNLPVLRLCTAPNILLTALDSVGLPTSNTSPQPAPSSTTTTTEGDLLDIDALNLSQTCRDLLSTSNVNIDFISGSWGTSFIDLLKPLQGPQHGDMQLLVLASETIYSPTTLPQFTSTLLSLLRMYPDSSNARTSNTMASQARVSNARARQARALIASKKIYFGVGGGIDEFVRLVRGQGGVVRTVWESQVGEGVGRVVVEVTVA